MGKPKGRKKKLYFFVKLKKKRDREYRRWKRQFEEWKTRLTPEERSVGEMNLMFKFAYKDGPTMADIMDSMSNSVLFRPIE